MLHQMIDGGESTECWAIRQPGFIGSLRQLTICARCGEPLPPKRHDQKIRLGHRPVLHVICDGCFDAIPE